MNHYEELGIAQNASLEEIRHAYKALVRLLHPDQFPDESLKRLAELQMRRLHQMLAVLSDPAERRRYDFLLEAPSLATWPPGTPTFRAAPDKLWSRRWAVALCAWLAPVAGLGFVIALVLYYGAGAHDSIQIPVRGKTAEGIVAPSVLPIASVLPKPKPSLAAAADPEILLAQLRESQGKLLALQAERQKLLDQLGRVGRPFALQELPPEIPPAPNAPVTDNRAVTALQPLEAAAVEVPGITRARLSGNWYYVPDPHQVPAKGVYTPEYIELRLHEDAGTIRGRYHARYRITDQAISPEVVFQFEGPAVGPIVQLPWTGAGDSKGNVVLRLDSADQLFVSWTASRLSTDLNLASGMAQLVLQKESR